MTVSNSSLGLAAPAIKAKLLLCHLIKSMGKAFIVIFVPKPFIFMVCFCLYSVQEQAFSFENSKKMLPGLFNIVNKSKFNVFLKLIFIDRIHKWRSRNYSFDFMLIILTSLTLKQKVS